MAGVSSDSLSILHVDAERLWSGGEAQVFLLMEGLRERGHSCLLAAPAGSAAAQAARARGFEVLPVPMRNDMDLRSVLALRRALRSSGAQIAHLHTGRATWLGGLAARWSGCAAITTRRMERRVRRGRRTRLIYAGLTQRVAAISPAVADCLRAGGVEEGRIALISDAVDPEALKPRRARGAVRAELEVDGALLITVGALVRRKGIDVALEALAQVQREPEWTLAVVGDGPERAELEALTQKLGLAEFVRFLGRRSDVPDLLAAADLYLMPSRAEGLGVAALEAMAAERAVIASEVGGLADVVASGSTGLLVPPADPGALAQAIRRLLGAGGERKAMGLAGRARLDGGFLVGHMVEAYEKLYRVVLRERATA